MDGSRRFVGSIICRKDTDAVQSSDTAGAIQSGRPRDVRDADPELPWGPVGNHGIPVDVRSTPEAVADGARFRRRSPPLYVVCGQ